jgi:hypothetical protein
MPDFYQQYFREYHEKTFSADMSSVLKPLAERLNPGAHINMFVWMTVIGTGIAFERGAQMGMVTLFNVFPLHSGKESLFSARG